MSNFQTNLEVPYISYTLFYLYFIEPKQDINWADRLAHLRLQNIYLHGKLNRNQRLRQMNEFWKEKNWNARRLWPVWSDWTTFKGYWQKIIVFKVKVAQLLDNLLEYFLNVNI